MTSAVFLTVILLPVLGSLGDKVSSTIIIPISFAARGLCGYTFAFIDKPDSILSIGLSCLLIITSAIEAISIEVLFMKDMPSEIRGSMMGIFNVFGHIGSLVFTLVGGQLYDRVGPSAPFIFLASMDTGIVLLTIGLTAAGKLKSK